MRSSNIGFTFFDSIIKFLTGQHTYFLISEKDLSEYRCSDPVIFNERYSGSFDSLTGNNHLLRKEMENFGYYNPDNEFESMCSTRQLSSEVPEQFCLSQNFPNPFRTKTMISYQCPMKCFVSLKVYNVMWKEMSTLVYENQSPGTYQAEFDGSSLKEGIYFYRIDTENFSDTKKMFIEK